MDFNLNNTITFNYNKIYTIIISLYKLDNKRRRFKESINSSKSEIKKEYVKKVISKIVPKQYFDLILPKLPSSGVYETLALVSIKELKKAIKFLNKNVINDLTLILSNFKINSISYL